MKPTLKNCTAAFGECNGLLVFGLIQGAIPHEWPIFKRMFPQTVRWVNQCHNWPKDVDIYHCAIDELLENHGIEVIRGRHVDNYHYDAQAVYSNTGDAYAMTVLFDNERQEFVLTSMGDWVEKYEKLRKLI